MYCLGMKMSNRSLSRRESVEVSRGNNHGKSTNFNSRASVYIYPLQTWH